MSHHHDHDDFGGLRRDLLSTGGAMDRRHVLRLAALSAGFGALQLLGCRGADTTSTTPSTPDSGSTNPTYLKAPEETQGPYPGDGSNGANLLNQTGVVRSDIRSSFAGLSGSAAGASRICRRFPWRPTTCLATALRSRLRT